MWVEKNNRDALPHIRVPRRVHRKANGEAEAVVNLHARVRIQFNSAIKLLFQVTIVGSALKCHHADQRLGNRRWVLYSYSTACVIGDLLEFQKRHRRIITKHHWHAFGAIYIYTFQQVNFICTLQKLRLCVFNWVCFDLKVGKAVKLPGYKHCSNGRPCSSCA